MTEPHRISIYDLVLRTLKMAERNTYIHRIIYCADHMFKTIREEKVVEEEEEEKEVEEDGEESEEKELLVYEVFEKIINTVNSEFCDERLTGLLLYYPNYFVHLIDGAEDSIMKHFEILFNEYKYGLGRTKVLVVYHHANQRFFDSWAARTAKPPTLLEKINPASDVDETYRYLDMCIQKIYNLATELRKQKSSSVNQKSSTVNTQSRENFEIGNLLDNMMENLPEYSLLDFLLNSQYLENVEYYLEIYMQVPDVPFADLRAWPVRGEFVPRDVFDQEQELIPDLPKNT